MQDVDTHGFQEREGAMCQNVPKDNLWKMDILLSTTITKSGDSVNESRVFLWFGYDVMCLWGEDLVLSVSVGRWWKL
jgi:hypothetical protein